MNQPRRVGKRRPPARAAPPQSVDIFEVISRVITLSVLVITVFGAIVSPILAISWRNNPFPGFLVEPTMVVTDNSGLDWPGREAGIAFPERVIRVSDAWVRTGAEFTALLSTYTVGQRVSVFTRLPDGTARLHPTIRLIQFPFRDMLRRFWLPYLIGLTYLGIGVWVYRLKGDRRPGRAFAFFCFVTAFVCIFNFDLYSTHAAAHLWTLAMAQTGGALISLAMRFPIEWEPVDRRPWLLTLPYLVALSIGVWGVYTLGAGSPWDYVSAWSASFLYTSIGIVIFLAVMLHRARNSDSPVVRQQARVVLVGSALAFTPIMLWFLLPYFNLSILFNPALLLPPLLLFPAAVSLAILRYRLLQIDEIANRTIFYGLVTAVLAGVFAVATTIMQKMFVSLTGEKSDVAIVMATLIIVAVITSIRPRVDRLVQQWVKGQPENNRELVAFAAQVQAFVQMNDPHQLTRRFLEESVRGLRAESGAVSLFYGGELRTVHTLGPWQGHALTCVPLDHGGRRYGLVWLGPRDGQHTYTPGECTALQTAADDVARALHLVIEQHRLTGYTGAVRNGDAGPGVAGNGAGTPLVVASNRQ